MMMMNWELRRSRDKRAELRDPGRRAREIGAEEGVGSCDPSGCISRDGHFEDPRRAAGGPLGATVFRVCAHSTRKDRMFAGNPGGQAKVQFFFFPSLWFPWSGRCGANWSS
jgi:hypothetical protein